MINKKKEILVTCAFPYANGSIHIGHLLEHIQADIWVRYLKITGHTVAFICSDDSHGTPILLKSQKLRITPKELIKQNYSEHISDFYNFDINHDIYSSTHSSTNLKTVISIFNILNKKNFIIKKTVLQLYDKKKEMFLPDRLIKGDCPNCTEKNQYGDHCSKCGSTYNALDLKNPISLLTLSKPILKSSKHLFFDLPKFQNFLKSWIKSIPIQKTVLRKTEEWLNLGLKPWNISRDDPYFGFSIPNYYKKYFYVWMDASIGYISTFKILCKNNNDLSYTHYWKKKSNTKLYQFIGKDIIYFHTLFWPAILEAISFRKPTNIFVHGHVTLNGEKLSKSTGNSISAKKWLQTFDSDCLRYYYASQSSSNIEDIEINLLGFSQKINSDIVNKIINIASRSASFINKFYNSYLSKKLIDVKIYNHFLQEKKTIEKYYENREFRSVTQKVINLADIANKYINENKPWLLIRKTKNKDKVQEICSMGINLFRIIATFIKPITPSLCKKIEKFLQLNLDWENIKNPILDHKISTFFTLYNRIQKKTIQSFEKNIKKIT